MVELASDRADQALQTARERADGQVEAAGVSQRVQAEIESERDAEDKIVATVRENAEQQIQQERAGYKAVLLALLEQERLATDDTLASERGGADKAVAARDDFLGIASHDLRNMLSGISWSADSISAGAIKQGDSGGLIPHTERIKRFLGRMSRLVDDLLDVVSLEAGSCMSASGRPTLFKSPTTRWMLFALRFHVDALRVSISVTKTGRYRSRGPMRGMKLVAF